MRFLPREASLPPGWIWVPLLSSYMLLRAQLKCGGGAEGKAKCLSPSLSRAGAQEVQAA